MLSLIVVPSLAVCFPIYFEGLVFLVLLLTLFCTLFEFNKRPLFSFSHVSEFCVWTLLLLATQPVLTVYSLLDQGGTTDWQQTKPELTDVYVV